MAIDDSNDPLDSLIKSNSHAIGDHITANDGSLSAPSSPRSVRSMQSAEEDDDFHDARSMFSCSSGGFGRPPEAHHTTLLPPEGRGVLRGAMVVTRRTSSVTGITNATPVQKGLNQPFGLILEPPATGSLDVPAPIAQVLSKSLGKRLIGKDGKGLIYIYR